MNFGFTLVQTEGPGDGVTLIPIEKKNEISRVTKAGGALFNSAESADEFLQKLYESDHDNFTFSSLKIRGNRIYTP